MAACVVTSAVWPHSSRSVAPPQPQCSPTIGSVWPQAACACARLTVVQCSATGSVRHRSPIVASQQAQCSATTAPVWLQAACARGAHGSIAFSDQALRVITASLCLFSRPRVASPQPQCSSTTAGPVWPQAACAHARLTAVWCFPVRLCRSLQLHCSSTRFQV